MNKTWPNILATISIVFLLAGLLAYLGFSNPKPRESALIAFAGFPAIIVGAYLIIRFYFLVVLLKKLQWFAAICTTVQIGALLWLLFAYIISIAIVSAVR
ncbi:MAG: hypothetical protein KDD14_04905 [Saprospiraceae bacterium]|nr:hypothetical protein [Saprospiraceae bacterium]